MLVGIHSVNSVDICGICRESMDNSDAIAHDGVDGDKHPLHRKCFKEWIKFSGNYNCPSCKSPIEANSLFTWKERVIVELNQIKEDVYEGIAQGTIGGAALGIALVGGVAGVGTAYAEALPAVAVGANARTIGTIMVAVGGALLGLGAAAAVGIVAIEVLEGRVERPAASIGAAAVAVTLGAAIVAGDRVGTAIVCGAAILGAGAVGGTLGAVISTVNGFLARRGLLSF